MLITCPECQILVSDKAVMCPHCGYPFKPDKISPRKSTRKKRLPNGFGQIAFIKGNLRKPYRAMITVAKNENGRPICKLLQPEAYFATYNEAYEALMRNNKGVYVQSKVTMNELFDLWKEYHLKNLDNPRSFGTYKAAWTHATSLHKLLVINVHVREIADCLESIDASANTISALKITLNMMFDYAVSHELTDKNYAKMYTLPGSVTKETAKESDLHSAFTDQELKLIQENINTGIARLIYIQCFTGFRPSELLEIKTKDIDLFGDVIVGGMKTEYGRNRTVPIHSEIKPMIGALVSLANNKKSPYLISKSNGKPISYESYREHFISTLSKIKGISDHVPHDPRKTFITRAKYYGVDEYAIKRIVGHSIKDITEKTYTQRDNEWLKTEIEKIKRP